jgi:hypothetical protein
MATAPTIEDRLAAVESAVAEIQRRMARPVPSSDWLQQLIGSFKDEPAFDEVLAYGREMRERDRPPEEDVGG